MGNFDETTLRERLSQLTMQRRKSKAVSPMQAAEMLRGRLDELNEQKLQTELYPLMPAEQQVGLLTVIKAAVGRVIQHLETLEGI